MCRRCLNKLNNPLLLYSTKRHDKRPTNTVGRSPNQRANHLDQWKNNNELPSEENHKDYVFFELVCCRCRFAFETYLLQKPRTSRNQGLGSSSGFLGSGLGVLPVCFEVFTPLSRLQRPTATRLHGSLQHVCMAHCNCNTSHCNNTTHERRSYSFPCVLSRQFSRLDVLFMFLEVLFCQVMFP